MQGIPSLQTTSLGRCMASRGVGVEKTATCDWFALPLLETPLIEPSRCRSVSESPLPTVAPCVERKPRGKKASPPSPCFGSVAYLRICATAHGQAGILESLNLSPLGWGEPLGPPNSRSGCECEEASSFLGGWPWHVRDELGRGDLAWRRPLPPPPKKIHLSPSNRACLSLGWAPNFFFLPQLTTRKGD
jgi:hypothetical protein